LRGSAPVMAQVMMVGCVNASSPRCGRAAGA
jgi:hypothetical protein